MKNLKSFTLIDLCVVIGLVLVLSGATLIMFGKVSKGKRDTERINAANDIYDGMQAFYKGNFSSYPVPESTDGSPSYKSVIISKDNDTFLQISLTDKITKLAKETLPEFGYVYVYSNDGQQAAIIVRRLETNQSRCNTNQTQIPEIVKDYLTKDPKACYFKSAM